MKNALLNILIVLLVATVLVAICYSDGSKEKVEGITFDLPEGMTCEHSENETITFFRGQSLVGGAIRFDTPSYACLIDPVSCTDAILSTLVKEGVECANNPAFDYHHSVSIGADSELWFGGAQEEYMYYLFFAEFDSYAVWIDRKLIDSEEEKLIRDSIDISDFNE